MSFLCTVQCSTALGASLESAAMLHTTHTSLLAAAAALLLTGSAHAQPGGFQDLSRDEPTLGRATQRIERIEHEDAGNRIEELREGGQTQRIRVQPKTGNMPAYEVQPADTTGRTSTGENGPGSTGRRVWRIPF